MIALLGYAVLLKYAGWILFAIFVYLMFREGVPRYVRWRALQRGRRVLDKRAAREYDAQLDRENREWLEAGIYEGQYPAETMPLTRDLTWHDGVGWTPGPTAWDLTPNTWDEAYPIPEPRDWYDYPSDAPPDWSGIIKPK